jgi:hypothetical protein
MAVRILLAGACALGTAAAAQSDVNPAPTNRQPQASPGMAPEGAENPSGYGEEAAPTAAPSKDMTMSQKKQSLENIKKAIRDSETHRNRASSQETNAETGATAAKPMGVQHLKVFRRGDKVVLRGTVRSQEEKDRIGNVAQGAASGELIVNELKVK